MRYRIKRGMASAILLIISIAMQLPVAAQALSQYRITGVRSDDVLNIREQPSAGAVTVAPVIGTIPWNADAVEATGVTLRIGNTLWREVRYGATVGWVNGRYLQEVGPLPYDVLDSLDCSGTEPFWSLHIRHQRAEFSNLASADPAVPIPFSVARHASANRSDLWSYTLNNASGTGTMSGVLLWREGCSDGMSDMDFPLELILLGVQGSDGPWQGCCSLPRQ